MKHLEFSDLAMVPCITITLIMVGMIFVMAATAHKTAIARIPATFMIISAATMIIGINSIDRHPNTNQTNLT